MQPIQEAFARLESMNVLSALSESAQEYWKDFKTQIDGVLIQTLRLPVTLDYITKEQRVHGYTFRFLDADGVSHTYPTTRFQTFFICEQAWFNFRDTANGKLKVEEATDIQEQLEASECKTS